MLNKSFDFLYKEVDESTDKHIAAMELLKELLQKYNISSIELSYNQYGKPYLKDYPNIFFSISHSYSFVACAVSNYEIGIDIEKIRENKLDIAKRFFTKNEYLNIKSASDFYRYWVCKEAYIKMKGKGLSMPLNSFSIDDENIDAKFFEIDDIKGYKCAICIDKSHI